MTTRRMSVVWLIAVVSLTGCGAREQPVAAAPVRDEAVAAREELFGAAAAEKGIEWRASGLGIRMITPGTGAAPKMMDRVRVHYTGRTKDGKIFDDSRARGVPQDFAVNRLLRGWAAGMVELKPGGKAEFFIPPSLGYGNMRVAGIAPGSGLIFEVELIAVNPE